jgi:hypothetical protein
MRKSRNQIQTGNLQNKKLQILPRFSSCQIILLDVFETPECHILPVDYIAITLLNKQQYIICLRSVAAGCNWPCGCHGSTLIIQDLLTDQTTYLLTYSVQHTPSEANRFSTSKEIPHIFKPEGSLPYSQVPASCPYPELAQSSPNSYIPLPEHPS